MGHAPGPPFIKEEIIINYRKRRPKKKHNKNQIKASRDQAQQRILSQASLLKQDYPQVRSVSIQWSLTSPEDAVLAEDTVHWGPEDHVLLEVACEGGCGQGVFSLTDDIHELMRSSKSSVEISRMCTSESYLSPQQSCGAKFQCRVSVS